MNNTGGKYEHLTIWKQAENSFAPAGGRRGSVSGILVE